MDEEQVQWQAVYYLDLGPEHILIYALRDEIHRRFYITVEGAI